MGIPVECPDCSKRYSVPEERVGSTFRCKVCKGTFTVEALEESELVKSRRERAQWEKKAAARQSAQARQGTMKLVGIFLAVAILLGIGVTAQMVPQFRDFLAKTLLATGLTCFIFAWIGTIWTEENILLRMVIRYFPPAIFLSMLLRLDETWPFLLLAVGGVVASVSGLAMGAMT